jgi:hypothetical protein
MSLDKAIDKGKTKEVEWVVRDDVNIKPRGTYTKEELEEMEKAKLKCLELLEKIKQETKSSNNKSTPNH